LLHRDKGNILSFVTTNAQYVHIKVIAGCKTDKGFLGFEFFTAVAMNNPVFSYVTPCCRIRRFGGKYRLHLQGKKNPLVKKSSSRLLTDLTTFLP
jgi:hypothetical protein